MTEQLLFPLRERGKQRWAPSEPIVRQADVGEVRGHPCRWSMTRAWGAGPPILWCGVNPSHADGNRDDPSTHRMMGFSWRWGFGSMVVVNLQPFVSSDPTSIPGCFGIDHFKRNVENINRLLVPIATCVAAWGCSADPSHVETFLSQVRRKTETEEFGNLRLEIDWHCIGVNDDASPTHPLARGRNWVPSDAKLKLWRAGKQ